MYARRESQIGQDVREARSCTCLAEVLQESGELANQKLYDATAINLIDVTHISLLAYISEVQ
jgi:hypothetical protein